MIRKRVRTGVWMVMAGLLLSAWPARGATDGQLINDAKATRSLYEKTDPGLASLFDRSAGYVIFPSVAKGAVGVGAAHGAGILFRKGTPIGRAGLTQVTVGAQLGGQEYSQVIFFETPAVMSQFERGKFAFSGQASAVALKSGASAAARFQSGVMVVTAAKGGLMFEASLGGQKFSYEPFVQVDNK